MRRALVFALLAGCSAPAHGPTSCPAGESEALVNAASGERFLGLGPEHISAFVQLTSGSEPDAPLCSGTFVTPDWVVTAAHCLAISSPHVVLENAAGAEEWLDVAELVAHPDVDVALVRVAKRPRTLVAPLAPLGPDDRPLAVADDVELAGYGLTEAGETRELRFLVEQVTAVEEASVVVSGRGENGACEGDSGGPVVVRDASGGVRLAGVLTSGSPTCLEQDRYVRLDRVSDWLDVTTGGPAPSSGGCGGIDETGRCLYGSALHCAEGKLVAEACTGDRACGWDTASSAYRCVAPKQDPCGGVDSVGACSDDVAMQCEDGVLLRHGCACGQECRRDGRTGAPRCAD